MVLLASLTSACWTQTKTKLYSLHVCQCLDYGCNSAVTGHTQLPTPQSQAYMSKRMKCLSIIQRRRMHSSEYCLRAPGYGSVGLKP